MMYKKDIFKELSASQFIDYLKSKYSGNKIHFKIFNNPDFAIQFMDGILCFGTFEYYRFCELANGRKDINEGVNTKIIGVAGNVFDKHNNLIPIKSRSLCTGLLFCLSYFNNTDNNITFINELISDNDKKLGNYICVLDNINDFKTSLNNINFYKCIEDDSLVPIIYDQGMSDIQYIKGPNFNWYEKSEEFQYQQETRVVMNFRLNNHSTDRNTLKARFLFKIDSIKCELIKIK